MEDNKGASSSFLNKPLIQSPRKLVTIITIKEARCSETTPLLKMGCDDNISVDGTNTKQGVVITIPPSGESHAGNMGLNGKQKSPEESEIRLEARPTFEKTHNLMENLNLDRPSKIPKQKNEGIDWFEDEVAFSIGSGSLERLQQKNKSKNVSTTFKKTPFIVG